MNRRAITIIGAASLVLVAATLACGETAAPTPTASPLTVTGAVTDENGSPLADVYVALLSGGSFEPATDFLRVDEFGKYRLEAEGGPDYILLVLSFSGNAEQGYELHGHMPHTVYLESASGEIERNVALAPCHDYVFEGYTADGSLTLEDDFHGTRFAVDSTDSATTEPFFGINKGDGTPSMLSACVHLGQHRRFFVTWSVPGFAHNIVLEMDNGGAGYTADLAGGTVLNVNYEIARAQVARLTRNVAAYRSSEYHIPASVADDLAQAKALLEQAAVESGATQAKLGDEAAGLALWALERLELARAEEDISRYRQGNLTVTVVDEDGNPIEGATVSYQQTNHDFMFGVYDTMRNAGKEGYELMRDAGVNYATAGFYWLDTEPEDNKIDWSIIDHSQGVRDLKEMGFEISAHPLIWMLPELTPAYLLDMGFDQLNQETDEHVRALVSHYQDDIQLWNVINEATARHASADLTREQITTLTQTGIRATRESDPDARIIINNLFDWYGSGRAIEMLTSAPPAGRATGPFELSIPAYWDQLEAEGVDYDVIGQQLYNGGLVDLFAEWNLGAGDYVGVATWDLARHSMILDRLSEYGKPVHVTEQSVGSSWDPAWSQYGAGWWHRPWDEETQAEFVVQFYTIAFSKERVEAITWWDINDRESFIVTGGLLDEDSNPKQAYYALEDLIDGWTTSGSVQTDSSGQVTIQGYGGEYALAVTYNGKECLATVRIMEQKEETIVIECQ